MLFVAEVTWRLIHVWPPSFERATISGCDANRGPRNAA